MKQDSGLVENKNPTGLIPYILYFYQNKVLNIHQEKNIRLFVSYPTRIVTGKFNFSILIFFLLIPLVYRARASENDSTAAKHERKVKIAGYPAGGYSPETSFEIGALGVLLINPSSADSSVHSRPSTITPYFLFTLKSQFLSAIKSDVYIRNRYYLNANLRYFNYPDLYFGTGNDVNGESERYTDRFIKLEARFSRIISYRNFAGLDLHWEYDKLTAFKSGGILESGSVNGTGGGKLLGLGPYYKYDSRNNVLYPTRGWYLETAIMAYPDKFLNDYSFINFFVDARYYTTVFSKKDILALQAWYNYTGGNSIPFYVLPRLGGDSRLRGIKHENLYRDHNAYYFQLEGRRHLFWRIGGVLFAGVGEVNASLTDFQFKTVRYVFGIGGRFQPFKNEKLNLRLDIGKGPGSQYAAYLAVGEAF